MKKLNTHECMLSGHLFDIEKTTKLGNLYFIAGHFDQREEHVISQMNRQKHDSNRFVPISFCFLEELQVFRMPANKPSNHVSKLVFDEKILPAYSETDLPPPKIG